MKLFVAGLSFKTAPVGVREKLAVEPGRKPCRGCLLKLAGGLSELVLLSTCNRVEIYGATNAVHGNARRLFQSLLREEIDLTPYLYVKEGVEAARHLFAVCGGLDSLVVGETEITGQVKQAYQDARKAGLTGRITNRLFQTAFQAAKEIRTETGIGRGCTSVGSVAVDLAERIFDQNLADKTVMIIGAGKMGEACVKHLAKKGVQSVLVVNRSYERARALAAEFGGRAGRFEDCLQEMLAADIVVSSTGAPQAILNREDISRVMSARRNRPLFLIDIAVPRDIATDVDRLENVYLYNVDHLEAIVRENVRHREQELARSRGIIMRRSAELMERFDRAAARAVPEVNDPRPDWLPGRPATVGG
jgi:glutamyl-tRNA reductase